MSLCLALLAGVWEVLKSEDWVKVLLPNQVCFSGPGVTGNGAMAS